MRYQCELKNLEFYAWHGLYEEEKVLGGKFKVDIRVETERDDHVLMNSLEEVINYESIYAVVENIMKQRENLIETVAQKILNQIGEQYPGLKEAEVAIEKLRPGGLFKSGSAWVTLSRKYEI